MGHQVDPRRARFRLEGFDQPKQVLGGPFQSVVLRFLPPGAGRDVVEAVDPDAVGRHLVMAFQVGQLPAINQDLVLLIEQQTEQRALELIEGRLPVTAHPHMGGAFVEPVERIVDHLVDPGGIAGEPPDIDDRQLLGHVRPPNRCVAAPKLRGNHPASWGVLQGKLRAEPRETDEQDRLGAWSGLACIEQILRSLERAARLKAQHGEAVPPPPAHRPTEVDGSPLASRSAPDVPVAPDGSEAGDLGSRHPHRMKTVSPGFRRLQALLAVRIGSP